MKKKQIIITLIVLPALLVGILAYSSLNQNISTGFTRNIQAGYATEEREIRSYVSLTGICGNAATTIYFRTTEPQNIVSFTNDLEKMQVYTINIEANQRLKNNFRIEVDSPDIRLFAGNLSAVITSKLHDSNNTQVTKINGLFFNEALQYSNGRFIIRRYTPGIKDFQLIKIDAEGIEVGKEQQVSIVKHQHGISTQGTLLFSKEENRLYFVYKLFNAFLCLDTNLNLVYAGHSIDTVKNPNIKTSKIKKHNQKTISTFSSPPQYTNYKACTANGCLYIYSKLVADNENGNGDPVIDVYHLKDGQYWFSFYLPNSNKNTLIDFKVMDGNLTGLFNDLHTIKQYKLGTLHKNFS